MVSSFRQMHLRQRRSWEALVSRMSPECRLAWELSGQAEEIALMWTRSPHAAFRDAGALMEMADYADRNAPGNHLAQLQPVRMAALQLRFSAASAMLGFNSPR